MFFESYGSSILNFRGASIWFSTVTGLFYISNCSRVPMSLPSHYHLVFFKGKWEKRKRKGMEKGKERGRIAKLCTPFIIPMDKSIRICTKLFINECDTLIKNKQMFI
jgi:hypothetical protein